MPAVNPASDLFLSLRIQVILTQIPSLTLLSCSPPRTNPSFPADVTGPSDATKAIFVIYDIFGFYPQTLQGADILSTSNDHQKYLVFVPDFFEGKPADISWYPPDNEDKKKKLGEFFSGVAAPPKNAAKVPDLVKAIGEKYSGIKSWGILGVSTLIVLMERLFLRVKRC
jgi:dienelactone hydrolase